MQVHNANAFSCSTIVNEKGHSCKLVQEPRQRNTKNYQMHILKLQFNTTNDMEIVIKHHTWFYVVATQIKETH
jgi:hypothetical protein